MLLWLACFSHNETKRAPIIPLAIKTAGEITASLFFLIFFAPAPNIFNLLFSPSPCLLTFVVFLSDGHVFVPLALGCSGVGGGGGGGAKGDQ